MPDESVLCKIGVLMGKVDSLIDSSAQHALIIRARVDSIDKVLADIKNAHGDLRVSIAEIRTEQCNVKLDLAALENEQKILKEARNMFASDKKVVLAVVAVIVWTIGFLAAKLDFHSLFMQR